MKARELKLAHALFIAVIGSHFPAQAQTTLILSPSQDTEIGYHDNYNSANTNYNSAYHLSAFAQPGAVGGVNKGRGLMKFNLAAIPADATVLGAFITFSASGPTDGVGVVTSVGSTGLNSAKLFRVTSPWNDNTATWNNQPSTTNMNAAPLPQSTYPMQNYLNVDVTTLVQDMVADPANSFGFLLKLDNETPSRGLCFYGGLAPQADKRPQLVVIYGDCGAANIDENDPATDHLTISPSLTSPGSSLQMNMGQKTTGTTHVVLMNSIGQTVFTRTTSSWPMSITIPAIAQGAYTWKVEDATGAVLGIARMVVQ